MSAIREIAPGWFAGACDCGAIVLGNEAAVREDLERHRRPLPGFELDPRRIVAGITRKAIEDGWRPAARPRPLEIEAAG